MSTSLNRDLAILAEKEILQKVTLAMRSEAGPKRWFWELLQNAIDTIVNEDDRKITVKVVLENKDNEDGALMHFTHNGAPFKETTDPNKFDDFKNLILPRSGKKKSNTKTVGKFGTGFLSTHNLSLKIDVSGVFEMNNGKKYYVETTLDRTYFLDEDDKYDSDRIASVIDGLNKFDESKREQKPIESELTKFTYHLNDDTYTDKVRTGFKDIEYSLPIVMSLNSKIEKIVIENKLDNENYEYLFGETFKLGPYVIQNCIKETESDPMISSVVKMNGENVSVCWPIEAYKKGERIVLKNVRDDYEHAVKDSIPLIYSTFPMIGSGELKFPIIVNSSNFKPNETRDGISLTNKTYTDENTKEKKELDLINKLLIQEAVKLYQQFITIVVTKAEYPYYLTKLNRLPFKDWVDKIWYKENVITPLRKVVSESLLVDVFGESNQRLSIVNQDGIQIFFPRLKTNTPSKISIRLNQKFYIFCSHLFKESIPLWKDLEGWHKVLWEDKDRIKILELEDIAKKVSSFKSIKSLSLELGLNNMKTYKWLNHLYAFIDEAGEDQLYKDYAIIPTQKGEFKKSKDDLYLEDTNSQIEPEIICILRSLNDKIDWFDKLVHRSVKSNHDFETRSLKDHIGPEINAELKRKDDVGYYEFLKNAKAKNIILRLLSLKYENESVDSNKFKVFAFYKEIFGIRKIRVIPYYNDFDISNVVKHAIRLINSSIEQSVNITGLSRQLNRNENDTIIWLNKFLNFQLKSTEFEGLIHSANVIPNQVKNFKAHGKNEDITKMYKPYTIVNNELNDILNEQIIKVLKDLSTNESDDWKNILVLDGIEVKTLPSKTWHDLGHDIDIHVQKILTKIVEDGSDQKSLYLNPMLTLLEWCENEENKTIAKENFKTTYGNKDKLYLQLTYSPDNVAILKDKKTLDIAKRIKKSGISTDKVNATLDVIESLTKKFGENSISEFISNAEKYISHKEKFKNRLATGQNIETLLMQTLEESGIGIDPKISNVGSYDILVFNKNNMSKKLKLEVKSYKYKTSNDFRFAPSQIIEANRDSDNYIVCTLERRENEEVCDVAYLKRNLKVRDGFGKLTSSLIQVVSEFDKIYEDSKKGMNPIEIPCIDEPRVKINKEKLLTDSGDFNTLIQLIKNKLL